jgi:putative ABC transport system permease protein
MRELARRLWYLINRKRFEEALRQEMEAHREILGDPVRFGNTLRLREQSREMWGWRWLDDALRDFRLGARALSRSPGFFTTVVSSLALALFITIATFTVVNAYLIRSLPYPEADRLYHVIYAPTGRPEPGGMAAFDWRDVADVVELADSSRQTRLYVVHDGGARRDALGLSVSAGSLEMLGVRASAGRSLEPTDFQAQGERAALVNADWWHANFGEGGQILGSTFRASPGNLAEPAETFRVVGLLPPGFRYARETARGPMSFVLPLRDPAQSYFLRLRKGVPVSLAEHRLTEAAKRIATSIPADWPGVRLESARQRYAGHLRPVLTAITAASGLVFLAAFLNIAVLILLRSLRRRQEVAVRLALGAGRFRIVRMFAAEACLVAALALASALVLSHTALGALAPLIEARLGLPAPSGPPAIGLDGSVFAVAGLLGLSIALMLSWIPVLGPGQQKLAETVHGAGRGATDGNRLRWFRLTLVSVEIGASLALIVGSSLMIRTVITLVRTDLGLQTAHVVRARAALPPGRYPDADRFLPYYDRLASSLSAEGIPFALTNFILLYDPPSQTMEVESGQAQRAGVIAVSEGFFPLFGIEVLQGRKFMAGDRPGSEPVAVISESLARRTWPDENAVGRRIRTAEQAVPDSPLTVWRTVVGVVRDIRQTHTDEDLADIYLPFAQAPNAFGKVFLKTDRPSQALKRVEAISASIDPQVLMSTDIPEAGSLEAEVQRLLAGPRFLMSLMTGFAVFALSLTLVGMYGVFAFAAQQRKREVAIRMAVGASPGEIVRLFLKEASIVVLIGLAIGSAGAIALGRLLRQQVYGVGLLDPLTLFAAVALVVATGIAAVWWPAQRAATQPPLRALREQ